ncbi:MAG: glutaminyl-peptide cyclotransferase [Gammaproteobacteria bacterium]|nr:glutaminyl-peptide cyclotransferase [Gammaproteobacteria bacterium]
MRPFLLVSCFAFLLCVANAQTEPSRYGFRVVNVYPHDMSSFTQGLLFHKPLGRRYFGEGIQIVGEKIYQLTWQSHMVFVYDKNDFAQLGTHYNPTEGWGLAFDGEHLILSDGSARLQFLNPDDFSPVRSVEVTLQGSPVNNLNELEYINGEVWANVWQTDFIVRIDPATGTINSLVDLTGLSDRTELGSNEAVLNGIAWDAESERLFVTGKHWAHLFEIELVAL